ncbi:hypothetical protein O181_049072 [Austropuccinia psidii MF-1]|uniref:Reverse transcriptase domain-containing protein n=1 Tax=Austropuccinia psidii MF-1 TaxID=1389203 RepID=A0A9Q3E137_9BASI|nr:hypothetical protein [Austropuccinia psidii MF-1]
MSETIIHKSILRNCGGDPEHALRSRCIEPCSTEDYINAMEDITTRTKIGRNWYKPPIDNNTRRKTIPIPNKTQDNAPLKCHKEELIEILFQYREQFASDNVPLGAIKGHEVDIRLNVEIPYPPLSRRPAYPASPRAREALETHIDELMKLGFLRNVGYNGELKVTTPVIITWHNNNSRIFGDVRALNTYTIPDRYPIPTIHETLTQLSKARFITSMDSLKVFHHNFLTIHSRKGFRIISHCGIYEYLRIPFGIKNTPSQYQRMMNTIFPHELSEVCLIIYIDGISLCLETRQFYLERLSLLLKKIIQVNIKISLKKFNFGFHELKALGHVVSVLSLGVDKNKVAEVLLKQMPQNK